MPSKQRVKVLTKHGGHLNLTVGMFIEKKLRMNSYTEVLHTRLLLYLLSIELDGFGYVVWLASALKKIAMLCRNLLLFFTYSANERADPSVSAYRCQIAMVLHCDI